MLEPGWRGVRTGVGAASGANGMGFARLSTLVHQWSLGVGAREDMCGEHVYVCAGFRYAQLTFVRACCG